MPLRSSPRLGRKPSGRKRLNVMIDPRKLKDVAVALDAPSNSAAIDAALDHMLEQHRFAEALEKWGGRFPDFTIPGA